MWISRKEYQNLKDRNTNLVTILNKINNNSCNFQYKGTTINFDYMYYSDMDCSSIVREMDEWDNFKSIYDKKVKYDRASSKV